MGSRMQGGSIDDKVAVVEDTVLDVVSFLAAPFRCITLICFRLEYCNFVSQHDSRAPHSFAFNSYFLTKGL